MGVLFLGGRNLKNYIRIGVLAMLTLVVAMAFTNCAPIAPSELMTSSALGRDVCSARLKIAYQNTYFPFLSSTCNSCHASAHGSKDVNVSFNSFLTKSVATIDYKSITAHGGNSFSAAVNQPLIDAFKPAYTTAFAEYSACKARLGDGDYFDMALKNKDVPLLEKPTNNNQKWKTVTWNTEVDSRSPAFATKFKATIKIDVRAYVYQTNIIGMQFNNPRVTLAAGQSEVSIQGLKVLINDNVLNDVTAYSSLQMNMSGTTEIPLAAGMGSPSAVMALSGTEQISLELVGLSANRIDAGGGIPITPTPAPGGGQPPSTLPTSVTLADLLKAGTPNGVFAAACISCHNANAMSGGLNLTNAAAAKAAADNVVIRMNDAGRPMPTSGILDQRSRDVVRIWVTTGAN